MKTKKSILFTVVFLAAFATGYAQENSNTFRNLQPVRKGEIILADGTNLKFTNLTVANDSIAFYDSGAQLQTFHPNDVYKISRTGNYAGLGAVSCGLGGLLGALSGTSDWNQYPELRDAKAPFIIGATVVCTGIGGIVGMLVKKEKTVYKNQTSIGFYPGVNWNGGENIGLSLTCRISLGR